MKIKEYFHSLIARRKSSSSSKSLKIKSHQGSISSTDGHYEICAYEDPTKFLLSEHPTRTEVLLNRHAQLVNTIVGIRLSQQDCRTVHQYDQEQNRNYSSTLATSNPHREYHQQTTSSQNSLTNKIRQRSKIRTNPWIQTSRISQTESSMYNPTLPSGLTHSESFPQTIANGNPAGNVMLHQSDSGHGFSLSSSRIIDSSSADNTSSDGPMLDERRHRFPRTNPSENKRRGKKIVQTRYQRPTNNTRNTTSPKKYHGHSRSSSPRVHHDHFSTEFEEILESERFNRRTSPTRKNPFILPLDPTDIEASSSSMAYPTTGTLRKTNSHTILKHIEEIENEIRLMKNLNLDSEEPIFSSNRDQRRSIHEQVDQWIDECLTTRKSPSMTRLNNECTHLSDRNKNYSRSIHPDELHQTSSLPKPTKKTEILTAFYVSSISTPKQSLLTTIESSSPATRSQIIATDWGSIHECPF